MRIQSITIAGFRSFGPNPERVELARELTAIVGPNASGKTALLQAFAKIFGVTRAQRTLHRSDFHLPPGVAPDDRITRDLVIDVVIALPELRKGTATADTVAPTFRHMHIAKPKEAPVCRLRLEGRWEDDSTADGEITQELFWVDHVDEKVEADDKHVVSPSDRLAVRLKSADDEETSEAADDYLLSIPWQKPPSRKSRQILIPLGIHKSEIRPTRIERRARLVSAIARGRRWLDEIVSGSVTDVQQIASRQKCSVRQVNMTISLAFLAPDLVRAAVEGRLPRGIGVERLRDASAEWSQQFEALGLNPR